MAANDPDKSLMKELARRRVFVFFLVFTVIALGNTLTEESDKLAHAFDDYAIIGLSVITLVYLGLSWKKQSLSELRKQHNLILFIFIIALVVQIYAVSVEISDPADFANEFPSLILIIFLFINRFI